MELLIFIVGIVFSSSFIFYHFRQMDKKLQELSRVTDAKDYFDKGLIPLKESLLEFHRKLEENHRFEIKERASLKTELERIHESGLKMTQQTLDLTQALKSNHKKQGIWGEFVLEKILRSTGLREGEDFVLQGKQMGLKDENNKSQLPDALIFLPDGKHLVVDAKVSLVSYLNFTRDSKEEDLAHFLDALHDHLHNLSSKKYDKNSDLFSPDFVMMFLPIEGAFSLAIEHDTELFETAWKKGVMIVGPTTFLTSLKTVSSLWRIEKQNKNATEIARQAGALYDKFSLILNEVDQLEAQVQKMDTSIKLLKNRLSTGKGSILEKVDRLKDLGARTSREIEH